MSINTENGERRIGGWQKLSQWLKAFDENLDLDPVEYKLAQASRSVSQLETRVHELESRLAARASRR